MQLGIHRGISTCRCQRLCPASPRPLTLQYRLLLHRLHHRRLSPLLRRHPHHLRHRRQYLCRTPRLRSSRALAVNWPMRDKGRCPGERVARPVQCVMHHGNTPVTMVCHWIMRPWCQYWTRRKRCTQDRTRTRRLFGPADRACIRPAHSGERY